MVIQTLPPSAKGRRENSAFYCLTLISLASMGLAAAIWLQMMELIPLKEITHQQSIELAENTQQLNKLTEVNLMLTQKKIKLKTELETAKKKAADAEAVLNKRNVNLSDLSAAEEVEGGLCAIIVQNIKMVESQLNRDDFFRLRDNRESDAETVLEQYQKELAECRSHTSRGDQDDSIESLATPQERLSNSIG